MRSSKIRANTGCGVLIDDPNVADVSINGDKILSNNVGNSDNGNGVCVTEPVDGLSVSHSTITNRFESWGHQKYAISIVGGKNLRIDHNDLDGNEKGTISSSAQLGTYVQDGNTNSSAADPIDNYYLGSIGAFSPAGRGVASWLIPYSTLDGLGGLGLNVRRVGREWVFASDGTKNGGSALLAGTDGSLNVVAVPSSGSASPRTLSRAIIYLTRPRV